MAEQDRMDYVFRAKKNQDRDDVLTASSVDEAETPEKSTDDKATAKATATTSKTATKSASTQKEK